MIKNLTLIDVIENEIASDDAPREKQSQTLIDTYDCSSDPDSIDSFLIALCGWSFDTLKDKLSE